MLFPPHFNIQLLFKHRLTYALKNCIKSFLLLALPFFSTMYNNYTFVNEINELPKGPRAELDTCHTLKSHFDLNKSLLENKYNLKNFHLYIK